MEWITENLKEIIIAIISFVAGASTTILIKINTKQRNTKITQRDISAGNDFVGRDKK